MRCFIGVSPHQEVRNQLFYIGQSILPYCTGKAVEIENIHSTLFFWNRLSPTVVDRVKNGLGNVKRSQINAVVKELDCFYSGKMPRILMARIECAALNEIHQQLREIFLQQGIRIDSRPLDLHMTLLRIKHVDNMTVFDGYLESIKQKFEELPFCLDSITLYQSILTQTGPIYKIIHDYKLK